MRFLKPQKKFGKRIKKWHTNEEEELRTVTLATNLPACPFLSLCHGLRIGFFRVQRRLVLTLANAGWKIMCPIMGLLNFWNLKSLKIIFCWLQETTWLNSKLWDIKITQMHKPEQCKKIRNDLNWPWFWQAYDSSAGPRSIRDNLHLQGEKLGAFHGSSQWQDGCHKHKQKRALFSGKAVQHARPLLFHLTRTFVIPAVLRSTNTEISPTARDKCCQTFYTLLDFW